ncbi:MAG: hypothetical protein IJH48_07070 [Oscillospiraceae bacterium]|nr:hypothetical protein [Oscillospiraceae bacterium]
MILEWKEDFVIAVRAENGEVTISANRDGLLSLASHLTLLAREEPGSHIHYDEWNALEEDSAELIIEKI